jgi:alkylation response protein AidB-like acyl-CoA dehydrogenase
MSMGACVLAINPLHAHHEDVEVRLQALRELATGQAIGCICITEPERGSDATRMLTTCRRTEDGLHLSGTKIYQTNGPKSKWAVVYATTEEGNPQTIAQVLVEIPSEGFSVERVNIPQVPRMWIGKETFDNVFVPNDQILGEVGTGIDRMFEGLAKERLGIAMMDISESWGAVTHATIYANLREQMGHPILLHQGVGFTLTDLWAQTTNLTLALLHACKLFDRRIEKFGENLPPAINNAFVTTASQLKYQAAHLAEHTCYEAANLMGGAGICDNTMMADLLGISRLQEIGGGTRHIQQYIMSRALRSLWKM